MNAIIPINLQWLPDSVNTLNEESTFVLNRLANPATPISNSQPPPNMALYEEHKAKSRTLKM